MAAVVGLHADAVPLDTFVVGDSLLSAGNISTNSGYAILTDTLVTNADTVQGLRDAVNNAVVHADVFYVKERINRAIDLGVASGALTDARILNLTTVAGLVQLTNATTSDGIVRMPTE